MKPHYMPQIDSFEGNVQRRPGLDMACSTIKEEEETSSLEQV